MTVKDEILDYIARLAMASREEPGLRLGISPRGALYVNRMAKAAAYLAGRDYVVVEDVQGIFTDVCAHRVVPGGSATEPGAAARILNGLLSAVRVPHALG